MLYLEIARIIMMMARINAIIRGIPVKIINSFQIMDDLPAPSGRGKRGKRNPSHFLYTSIHRICSIEYKKLRKMFHLDMNFDT
ncbi:hypothetical protein I3500192B8_03650 [Acidaminococcus intestini]